MHHIARLTIILETYLTNYRCFRLHLLSSF